MEVQGLTWVKGEPIAVNKATAAQGTVFVLEFWATWCPPCRDTIPHVTELQKKYPSAVFIGITSEQPNPVKRFVDNMGSKMDYRVAIDLDGSAQAYMERYGVSGIPHAFVLDSEFKVSWHGHPADPSLENQVAQCVKDVQDAKKKQEEDKVKAMDIGSMGREELMKLSVKELKTILAVRKVDATGLPEKVDLVNAIIEHCKQ